MLWRIRIPSLFTIFKLLKFSTVIDSSFASRNQSKLWLERQISVTLNEIYWKFTTKHLFVFQGLSEDINIQPHRTYIWKHMLGYSATSSLFQVIVLVISDWEKYRREFISKTQTRRHDNERAFSANSTKEFFFVARGNSDEMSLLGKRNVSQVLGAPPEVGFGWVSNACHRLIANVCVRESFLENFISFFSGYS